MRVIFLRTRIWRLLASLVTTLLITLFVLMLYTRSSYRNLLLVVPKNQGERGFTSQELEQFIKEEFMLTYEIYEQRQVKVSNLSYQGQIIGTNSQYAQILGYPLLSGGFFSQTAFDEHRRQLVLNKTAAYNWFGNGTCSGSTMEIDSQIWMVTGVIDDGNKKEARVYIPASLSEGQTQTLMVLLDELTVSEAYASSALKKLGIQDEGYSSIHLAQLAESFGERLWVSCRVIIVITLMLFLYFSIQRLRKVWRLLREELKDYYWRQLWKYRRRQLLHLLCGGLLIAVSIVGIVLMFSRILETCLEWKDLLPNVSGWHTLAFAGKLIPLYRLLWVDLGTFIFLLLLLPPIAWITARYVIAISYNRTQKNQGDTQHGKSQPT